MNHENKSTCIFRPLKHILAIENFKLANNKTNHLDQYHAAI